MNELIKIEVKDNGQRLVSARELHNFLQVGRDFTTWVKGRITEYSFIENTDFTVVAIAPQSGGANNRGGQNKVDYAITIEMAKELCMVEKNDYGKQARRYFIECEKQLKEGYQSQLNHYEQAKAEIDLLGVTARVLNLNDNSKLLCVTNIYNNHGIPTNILPQYTESKGQLLHATELLKRNSVNISAIKFNKLMLEQGLITERERPSSKGTKKFKTLVDTYWGENQTCPKIPKETQILYYADKFKELLHKLNLG